MPKIIVSYRRSDTQAIAGRIYDRLSAHYGDESVFMDIDKIPVGTDFRQYIRNELRQADVLLAIIGPRWLGPRDDGSNRIGERADPVRIEIETALEGGTPVVPVLVDGAYMPGEDQLPDTLKEFAFINAAVVDIGRDFRQHMDRLIRAMDAILTRAKAPKSAAGQAPAVSEELSVGEAEPAPVQPSPPPPARESVTPPPASAAVEPASERRRLHLAAVGLAAVLAIAIGAGAYYWSSDDRTASPKLISTPPAATAQAPVNPAASEIAVTRPTGQPPTPSNTEVPSPAKINTANLSSVSWRLQSTLPATVQTTLPLLTQRVADLSGGRMRVETFPTNAIVPAYEILDAVNKGVVEMGYATGLTSYGKHRALALMTAIPFGFTPRDHLAFRRRPDVRATFDELLSDGLKLDVVALPCGSLGRIGELWLKRPLRQKSDLAGLKLRVLGPSIDLYKALGSNVIVLSLAEVYTATQTGVIDGGQYLTPKADLDLGLATLMKTYYHPSSSQPAYALDLYVNKTKWNALPPDGREVIEAACREAADRMLIEQEAADEAALGELRKGGVNVAPVPAAIERELGAAGTNLLFEQRRDLYFGRIMRLAEQERSSQQPVSQR